MYTHIAIYIYTYVHVHVYLSTKLCTRKHKTVRITWALKQTPYAHSKGMWMCIATSSKST